MVVLIIIGLLFFGLGIYYFAAGLWVILKTLYYLIFNLDAGLMESHKKTPKYKAFEKELNKLIK